MPRKSTDGHVSSSLLPAGEAAHFWGAGEVKARLRESAEVLKCMRLGCRDIPVRVSSAWPDVVRQGLDACMPSAPARRPPPPSAAAISRADEAVLWLLWLDESPRRIVWARAGNIPWRRLEDMDGRSHTTLRRIETAALETICRRLNASLDINAALQAAFRQGREGRRAAGEVAGKKN